MKKYLLVALALILTFTLTGCGSDEETLSSVPSNLQGLYQGAEYRGVSTGTQYFKNYHVYKVEDSKVKEKICQIGAYLSVTKTISDCNFEDNESGLFETKEYDIKDLKMRPDDENIDFNIYSNNELFAKCYTTFGELHCNTNDGNHLSGDKKN